ncbi:MAG: TonB-dependent receptor [Acidobacteria bacterium]|nr:TonB-dependent receptor [Acidobacteriota bacterium]
MKRFLPALILSAGFALSQSNVASLTGIITDATGAVVPNVGITLTNRGTGIVLHTRSNENGVYVAPSLVAGAYQVEFEAKGFKKNQVKTLKLETAQKARLDLVLELGDVRQVVEVQAAVTPLQQETAEISETITAKDIQSIPLNGRVPYALLALTPGVAAGGDDPSSLAFDSDMSLNGSRKGSNAYVIDGASTTHIGGIAERIGSIESIQEFKVLSSTYSAEYGRTSGGVITFQVKGGTQEYHGALYEFHRNNAMAANSWENNARGVRNAVLIRNEFGGVFGGPVPGMRKKMFFFLNYEGVRDSDPLTKVRTIPDPSIRGGNFSRLPVSVFDPLNGQPFANNTIPPNRLDPAAQKFMQLFPAPNVTGIPSRFGINTNNWVRTQGRSDAKNFGTMRIDYNPTEKNKFFFTFSHVNEGPRDLVRDFENVLNTEIGPRFRNIRRATFGYTRFLTPALSSEFLISAQRDPRQIAPWYDGFDVSRELGIQRKVGANLPSINIAGGFGAYGDSRYQNWVHQPASASNIWTWLRGRHTIKYGAQLYQNQFWYIAGNGLSGNYSFNGEITGNGVAGRNNPVNALADLLLGAVKGADYPVVQIPVNRFNYNLGLFFNDDWKLTRRLTLNLGLRQEFETWQAVKNNVYSRVDLATGSLLLAGRNASRNLSLNNDYLNFSPRLGIAYSVNDKTVVRSGFAVSHSNLWVNNGEMVAYPGWTSAQTFPDQGAGRAQPFTFTQGFPAEAAALVPDPLALAAAANPSRPLPVSSLTYNDTDRIPYSLQWNSGIQREIGFSTVLDISYVGSRSLRLSRTVAANSPGIERARDVVINRVPVQQLRPFPNYSGFSAVFYDANAIYNSLQVKATRRFNAGLSVDVNYTFSKSIDNASNFADSFQIPWQYFSIERALSGLDRPQVFTLGAVYELPFGKGKPWLSDSRLLSALLGGFQVNGLMAASDGLPLTIRQTNTNLLLSAQRPDVVDPANLSGRGAGTEFAGAARRYLIAPNQPGFPFRASSNLGIGNLGRNTSREPGYVNLNLSLFRSVSIREKVRLELRFEGYNAFNHVNYREPASTDIDNANYGLITAAAPPRKLQIGARLSF